MPTLYLDYENGNDNYGGTSFALLASGTDGRITSSTFSSASASFPNDGSLINQYLSIFNGTIYAVYQITAWVSSTSLTIAQISGGTALANQTVDRQYYIGGRWKTITNGPTAVRTVPGDTIRVMASPDPTSLGTATWTGGGRPLAVNIASSTNATPIAITTSAAHGLTTGDTVMVTGHTTNTNANGVWRVASTPSSTQFTITLLDGTNTTGNGVGGATGTATKVTNCVVKLASALTQNVALCGGLAQKPAWTASTNVTATQTTTTGQYKEGYSAASIAVAAAFTTGKAAYYTLPSTLNLSSYQQVAFWVQVNSGTYASGTAYLALCSDTLGNTVVHQCPIPVIFAGTAWIPVVFNNGAALGTTINSVALYIGTDEGAQTWLIDNIVACKNASSADSLTLQSLISKSDGTGDEGWYAIQSINADTIMLANQSGLSPESTGIRGYNGTTETVTTYKRDTIKTPPSNGSGVIVQNVNEGGTADNARITYSGGWNRTDMSTQTGQSWFDGQNGFGIGISVPNNLQYLTFDRLHFCRYTSGFVLNADHWVQIPTMYAIACTTGISTISSAATNDTFTNVWCNNNSTGLRFAGSGHTATNVKLASNCTIGIEFNVAGNCTIQNAVTGNALTAGLAFTGGNNNVVGTLTSTNGAAGVQNGAATQNYVNGGSTTGSTTAGIFQSTGTAGTLYLNNFVINETVETSIGQLGFAYIYSNRHDNTDGNSWIFQGGGTVNQQTTVVDSPATTSWQIRPTNAFMTGALPVRLKLGTVVCAAGSLVTVTARMRRDNTGLTMRLCCPGGQISGVASDVVSDMTAAANTWETVTITFTPTKPGGVDIYAYAFGGTTFSGYVCNLTASQA